MALRFGDIIDQVREFPGSRVMVSDSDGRVAPVVGVDVYDSDDVLDHEYNFWALEVEFDPFFLEVATPLTVRDVQWDLLDADHVAHVLSADYGYSQVLTVDTSSPNVVVLNIA